MTFRSIIKKSKVYPFETSDLLDHNNFMTDIRQAPVFDKIFKDLDLKKDNCIYWFNLDNNKIAKEINSLLDINSDLISSNIYYFCNLFTFSICYHFKF